MTRRGRRRRSSTRRRQEQHRRQAQRCKESCPIGRIDIHPRGYAFVDTDVGSFYIPAKGVREAMPGDTVAVRPSRHAPSSADEASGFKRRGKIDHVVSRATDRLVGVLEINDALAVVVPQDPRISHDLFTDASTLPAQARDGDVVVARVTAYPTRKTSMEGVVTEVLGRADEPGMDIAAAVYSAGLPTTFSEQALEQASGIEVDVQAALGESERRDLRMREVFTIDPVDAKDFDDAISIDWIDGCVRLGVHIADVSVYVPWESNIDLCARDRGASAYLADRVIPMLPEKLSCDVCSLKPGCDRLAMTCDLYLDDEARTSRYEIYPSVICSKRRFDYDEVDEVLEGRLHDALEGKLRMLNEVARKLAAARVACGALDFDVPEAKLLIDAEGQVTSIDVRTRTAATSMIEEAMILANQTVAAHLVERDCSLVYRIHEPPRPAALETLLPALKGLGYPIEGLGSGDPRAFQRVLRQAAGTTEEALVSRLVLRSMERARYSTEAHVHFGLALKHYCHFTSPIRRYPDLMVHRLLKDPQAMAGQLEQLAGHASAKERQIEEVERDVVLLKLCEYLEQHVGEEFEGTISSVASHRIFVRLDITAEGLVRMDPHVDEPCSFDPERLKLAGKEIGRTWRVGQRVVARIKDVDVPGRSIRLELV